MGSVLMIEVYGSGVGLTGALPITPYKHSFTVCGAQGASSDTP